MHYIIAINSILFFIILNMQGYCCSSLQDSAEYCGSELQGSCQALPVLHTFQYGVSGKNGFENQRDGCKTQFLFLAHRQIVLLSVKLGFMPFLLRYYSLGSLSIILLELNGFLDFQTSMVPYRLLCLSTTHILQELAETKCIDVHRYIGYGKITIIIQIIKK